MNTVTYLIKSFMGLLAIICLLAGLYLLFYNDDPVSGRLMLGLLLTGCVSSLIWLGIKA